MFIAAVLLIGLTLVYLSFERVSAITRTAAGTFIDKVAQLGADRVDTQFKDVRDSLALKAQKLFSSCEWKRLYLDGTVVKWQQVSDFFMAEAGVTSSTRASDYFDPSLYLAEVR
jgi:hypothetical protein